MPAGPGGGEASKGPKVQRLRRHPSRGSKTQAALRVGTPEPVPSAPHLPHWSPGHSPPLPNDLCSGDPAAPGSDLQPPASATAPSFCHSPMSEPQLSRPGGLATGGSSHACANTAPGKGIPSRRNKGQRARACEPPTCDVALEKLPTYPGASVCPSRTEKTGASRLKGCPPPTSATSSWDCEREVGWDLLSPGNLGLPCAGRTGGPTGTPRTYPMGDNSPPAPAPGWGGENRAAVPTVRTPLLDRTSHRGQVESHVKADHPCALDPTAFIT